MPIKVTCAGCGATMSTPDSSAGKRAKCPKCATPIEIPSLNQDDFELEPLAAEPLTAEPLTAEPLTAAAPQAEDRRPCPACGEMIMRAAIKCRYCGEIFDKSMKGALHSSLPRGFDTEAWSKVRSGLATLYNCVGIMFGTGILIGVSAVISAAMEGPGGGDPPAVFLIIFGIGGFLMLVACIGMFVGLVRCTNAPKDSGAYGMAVGAVACAVGYIVLAMMGSAANNDALLPAFGGLCPVGGWIMFVIFIRRSAAYLGDVELAGKAGTFLWFIVGMFVTAFIMGFISAFEESENLLGIIGLIVIIGGVASLIWFLRLVRGLRMTIDREVGGTEYGFFSA